MSLLLNGVPVERRHFRHDMTTPFTLSAGEVDFVYPLVPRRYSLLVRL